MSWQLSTRLHLGDLLVFAAQPTVLASHMEHTGLVGWPEALAMAAACSAFLFVPWRLPLAPRKVAWLACVPAALLARSP